MERITYNLLTKTLTAPDIIVCNADNETVELAIDSTGTIYETWEKRCDLTMADGTTDILGFSPAVTDVIAVFTLTSAHMIKGALVINPYVQLNGARKGFPKKSIDVKSQLGNDSATASVQILIEDYIDDRLAVKAVTATTLAPSEPATLNFTIEADGVTAEVGVPKGDTGLNAYQQAVDGGYTDTEANFQARLSEIDKLENVPSDTLSELIDIRQRQVSYNGGSVSLWYDDGLDSLYTQVYPRHELYKIPAICAIITSKIGTAGYSTVEQLQEIRTSKYFRFASHTMTHPNLPAAAEATIKSELVGAYNQLKTWGLIDDFCGFVAPANMYNELVYRYAYLLHNVARDFPESITQGYYYNKPNTPSFLSAGSYEISNRLGKSIATQIAEVFQRVQAGFHVPLMLHGVDYNGNYAITPEEHIQLIEGLLALHIPITFPETAIERHNLIYDPIFEYTSLCWNPDAGSGTMGFETTATNVFFGNKSLLFGFKGTGTEPRSIYKFPIPVVAGKTYIVSWWAKGNINSRTKVLIEYISGRTVSAIPEVLGSAEINHVSTDLTTTFQRFSGTFIPPSGTQFIRLKIGYDINATTSGTNVWGYVDCISVHDESLTLYNI